MAALIRRSMTMAVLIAALGAGAAQASTVSVDGSVMTITARPGEENDVRFGAGGTGALGDTVRVIDSGSEDTPIQGSNSRGIVAEGTCEPTSNGTDAFCPIDNVTSIVVNLGDEDDEYDGSGGIDADTTLELGTGDDVGQTADGNDVVRGGSGADEIRPNGTRSGANSVNTVEGDGGNDTFDIRGSGADIVNGGADSDTATYRFHSNGVTVRLDATANDGRSNEGDNIGNDVEKVIGSSGGDTLTGNSSANTLEGGLGRDSFAASGGGDTFLLRDGVQDNGFCVNSNDTVDKDLQDPLTIPCAFLDARPIVNFNRVRIFQGAIDEGPNLRIRSRSLEIDDGEVAVRLKCPRKLEERCRGRIALREATEDAARLDRVRYRVRPGRSRTVTLELDASEQQAVRDRGAVYLVAVEQGDHGPKTTEATLPIG